VVYLSTEQGEPSDGKSIDSSDGVRRLRAAAERLFQRHISATSSTSAAADPKCDDKVEDEGGQGGGEGGEQGGGEGGGTPRLLWAMYYEQLVPTQQVRFV
jgi:hypothetical protein